MCGYRKEWQDRANHVAALGLDASLVCRVWSKSAGVWLLGRVVQHEPATVGVVSESEGTEEEGTDERVKVEFEVPSTAVPAKHQPKGRKGSTKQKRASGVPVVASKWVCVGSERLEWPLETEMPPELRLQIIDAELLRRSTAAGGAPVDGLDAPPEDESVERSQPAHPQPQEPQEQGGGPWWDRLGRDEVPDDRHAYLEAQGSKADVRPGSGVYRRREKYDAAVKKLREESIVGGLGCGGTQYILGVAGGADSVASQLAGGAVGGSILEEEEAVGGGGAGPDGHGVRGGGRSIASSSSFGTLQEEEEEEDEAQDQQDQQDLNILLDDGTVYAVFRWLYMVLFMYRFSLFLSKHDEFDRWFGGF